MATEEHISAAEARTDFFISYTHIDRKWAEWIAWHLEAQGYTTILHARDFQAGRNLVLEMDHATRQAEHTIAVLSQDYLYSIVTPAKWAAAFGRDPGREQGILLPVHVRSCDIARLLGQIIAARMRWLRQCFLLGTTSTSWLTESVGQTRRRASTTKATGSNHLSSPSFTSQNVDKDTQILTKVLT